MTNETVWIVSCHDKYGYGEHTLMDYVTRSKESAEIWMFKKMFDTNYAPGHVLIQHHYPKTPTRIYAWTVPENWKDSITEVPLETFLKVLDSFSYPLPVPVGQANCRWPLS
ncbi:hypothetical protein CL634_02290 [bacterium]|nr:hypothetical protein [bacterium]